MFFQSILPSFTHANMFLQKEEPLIHVLQAQLTKLVKTILEKFVKPSIIAESIRNKCLSSISFANSENQLDWESLVIGFITRQTLSKLLHEGEISERQATRFFSAAYSFFESATACLFKWCPMHDELLTNAAWLNFEDRLQANFASVEFFFHRFPIIFPNMNYMILAEKIPKAVKENVNLTSKDPYCIDVLWGYLRSLKTPGTANCDYDLLFKVAETIPHSNAGEKQIFSLINKNKLSAEAL